MGERGELVFLKITNLNIRILTNLSFSTLTKLIRFSFRLDVCLARWVKTHGRVINKLKRDGIQTGINLRFNIPGSREVNFESLELHWKKVFFPSLSETEIMGRERGEGVFSPH